RIGVGDGAAPEGGDLDDLSPTEENVHQTETPPDDARVAKQRPHVLGTSVGGKIEIFRSPVEQEIAHAATDEVGLKPVPGQPPDDLLRVRIDTRLVETGIVT